GHEAAPDFICTLHSRFPSLDAKALNQVVPSLLIFPVVFLFAGRLYTIAAGLDALEGQFGRNKLMGHTRMQAAIPITVSDR
ncbi:3-carboxy-cis,cis-muconate cycloisomerase, partial [Rhizobium johnstonii]